MVIFSQIHIMAPISIFTSIYKNSKVKYEYICCVITNAIYKVITEVSTVTVVFNLIK